MNFEKIINIITEIADSKLNEIEKKGHVESGVNGPYNCDDTPVRNTAHWCVTYSFLYKKDNKIEYKRAVKKLADYICDFQKNSSSGAIKCMNDTKFTDTNGLIGQAWAIEGLIYAYNLIKDYSYIECAKEIFDSQLFDYNSGQWLQIDSKGNNCGIDIAFNHQLWFAAIGYQLNSIIHDDKIQKELDIYEDKIADNFCVYRNGMIKHLGYLKNNTPTINKIKKLIKRLYPVFLTKKNPDSLSVVSFESAYQLFNLYGFAIIKQYKPNFKIFNTKKFKKALKYGLDIKKLNNIFNVSPKNGETTCKYAYSYNSPAFEYGFVAKVFDSDNYDVKKIEYIFNIGLDLCYSKDKKSFNRNTNDPKTLTARVYELIRLLEMI